VNPVKRQAVVVLLDKEMAAHDSWCGETHLQKAVFVLQELLCADTGYEFILYKHGPFSFEFRDDLASMRADGLLEIVVRDREYGPSYLPTEFANTFLERFPRTVRAHEAQVRFIAKQLADKNVSELEKIATALFIYKRFDIPSRRGRAQELVRLKPHISEKDAVLAIKEIDRLAEESRDLVMQG
jgi:hypothetical protein